MRANRMLVRLWIVLFSWCVFALPVQAAPTNDPVQLLKYIAENMISGLKSHQATLKTKPQTVYSLAYQYVVPYADLNEMSRRVISPQIWNAATPQQRIRFQKQFTTLLIRTYSSALSSYQDQTVKFYPVRGGIGGATVEVSSDIISPDSQPIHVTYRLVRTASGWRLFDMSVEGVSMLESFRSQFTDILASGNMEQLLQRLSSHNSR